MQHRLVSGIEQALDWQGPTMLGREFAVGSLPDPSLGTRLLTPQHLLDTVMRRSLAPPQVRCVRDGAEIPSREYLSEITTRRGQVLPMVDPVGLGRVLAEGATLVVDGLNRWEPTMEIACRALQWWAHENCQVNIYLTTQDSSGFALHWDDHDVLIVQLDGNKQWEVRGPSRVAPMFRDTDPNVDPPEEIAWSGPLRPGDVLHIPRGYWHRASRADEGAGHSLHATFGLQQRTGIDLLSWLVDQKARQHEVFRHDLPLADGPAPERSHALRQAATELMTGVDLTEYRRWRQQHHGAARHVVTHGLFGAIEEVVAITEFPPLIELDDEQVHVAAAGRHLSLPTRAEQAARHLLSGHPVWIDDVTAACGVDAAKIAHVLLGEGLCAEVTDALRLGCSGLVPTELSSNTR
ncbi:JmjC domain-containing protein [Actinopolyspora mortivallis]|uniref:Cupin n=1 Tax=Actinopolyspora mortivallis TaxID=33906 RepID=A0A2T0GRS0_ACTMO|nr:cupin domain-containing protein [Actinopolyspora mortivallis]PRW61806.1 cupin [Actinopolyspora mortivallis]